MRCRGECSLAHDAVVAGLPREEVEKMCLGVPGRVVAIAADGLTATVDFFGIRRVVRLELVDQPVAPGDYILNHVGYAIRRIPDGDIEGTLALYEQLMREADEDLMAADVRGEIEATTSGGR